MDGETTKNLKALAEQAADEVYGLHCDIGRLEQENDVLRTQLADATVSMWRVEKRCAELREAVRILVYCSNHVDCDGCPLNGNPYDIATVEWFACDDLREMIDKLGVEVEWSKA